MCPFVERLSFSPTAYSEIVAQQRSMSKCTIIVSQLVAFFSIFFSVFFHWMRPSNVYFWRSSCLDLGTTQVIIPQLISDPVSNTHQISIWSPPTLLHHKFTSDRVSQTHQMPRVVKWFKCPCHSITCSVYNILSQVGRFAYKQRLMSCLLSLRSTRWVYTLISCSVRLITILVQIFPGYFFVVVAPARRCPGSFVLYFVVIPSWPAAMSAICTEHVVCERITLLSFALYYPVRSCVLISTHISTVLQQSARLSCCHILSKGVYKHSSVKRIATASLYVN